MKDIDFASLLCSRLCHDLVGPVGAISNGVELLADESDPDMQRRCLELVSESAVQTANKLKFFRLAFGAAGGFGETVDPSEARGALEALFSGGKVQVEWMAGAAALPKTAVKILLNLAMTAGDALLRGGVLRVAAESPGTMIELAVRAEGTRVLLDPEIRRALEGQLPADALGPRTAAAHLVCTLLAERGSQVLVSEPESGVLLLGARLSTV